MMFALSLLSQGINAQEINRQLLVSGHAWGWLRIAITGSRKLVMMFAPFFSIRVRITQAITRQLLITGQCLGFAVDCKSRKLKFKNDVYSFIF